MINWLPPIPLTGRVEFPGLFDARAIFIAIVSPIPSVWRKAGYLRVEEFFDGEYLTVSYQAINFGKSRVNIPATSYRLSFEPVRDLIIIYPNTTISIYPLTLAEFKSVMPFSIPEPEPLEVVSITDSVASSFSAPLYLAATLPVAYLALPANPDRKKFVVTNLGTKTVYMDFDAPTTATKRIQSIPAGVTYISDIDYVGAVYLWSSATGAQACEIRELI